MSEPRRPVRLLRSVGALLAGLIAIVGLSLGTDWVMHAVGALPPLGHPMGHGQAALALAYRIVYGAAGSYIAARLATDRPMTHALALGVIGLAASTAGAAATWNAGPEFGPKWYPLALVATALPCAWVGGWLHGWRVPKRAA